MYNALIKSKTGQLCAILTAFITLTAYCVSPIDLWAETHVEYLDIVRSFKEITLYGWNGYFAFLPQLAAAFYNNFFIDHVSRSSYAKIATLILASPAIYISLLSLRRNVYFYILISICFTSLLAITSVGTLTNIANFYIIPFIFCIIKKLADSDDPKNATLENNALYLLLIAVISKPIFFSIFALLFFRRKPYLTLLIILITIFQFTSAAKAQVSHIAIINYLGILGLATSFLSSLGAVLDQTLLNEYIHKITPSSILPTLTIGISFYVLVYFLMVKEKIYKTETHLRAILMCIAIGTLILPFLQFYTQTNSDWVGNIYYTIQIIYSQKKLQYSAVAAPALLYITISLVEKLTRHKHILLITFILFSVSLISLNLRSISSDASSDMSLEKSFAQNNYWQCFAVQPYPGWGYELGGNVNKSLFVTGGCKRIVLFDKFDDTGFTSITNQMSSLSTQDNLWSYLVIFDKKSHLKKMNAQLSDFFNRTPYCSSLVSTMKVDRNYSSRYIYTAGTGMPSNKPISLYDDIKKCLRDTDVNMQPFNIVYMFPDPK